MSFQQPEPRPSTGFSGQEWIALNVWSPHSVTPTTDALLWIRWFASVGIVWLLPGWLLLRGRLQDWPAISRIYVRLTAGLVWVVVLGLTIRWSGRGLDPYFYVLLSPVIAFGTSRVIARFLPCAPPGTGSIVHDRASTRWWWTGLASLGLFVAVCFGFKDMSAPPHVNDTSNHVFLITRAAETGSLDPALLFSEIHPPVTYLAGWHLVAAITGSIAGVAPYISAWFMSITAVVMIPLGLATLWWRWGAGPGLATAATLWVMTNSDLPAGLPYSWGGLGVQIGFFIAPLGALLLAEALRKAKWVLALAAGAYLAATVHIHFSEVFVIPSLALLTWIMQRRAGVTENSSTRTRWAAAGLFVLGLAIAFEPSMLESAGEYSIRIGEIRNSTDTVAFSRAIRSYPLQIGPPDLRFLWAIAGIVILLGKKRWRPIALASVVLGTWVIAMKTWNDPVSSTLASPFYSQPARTAYQQIYVLPFAAGAATVALLKIAASRGRVWSVLAGAATTYALFLGYAKHDQALSSLEHSVSFDRAEYFLAREITDVVPVDEVVANYQSDGSTWAWQVSGRQFLNPMFWNCIAADGTALMPPVLGLRENPWPTETRALQKRGVRWLYVSSNRLRNKDLLSPEDFENDPRFTTVLERGGTKLLRINWDEQAQ